jgi:hypothetical protein
MDLRKSSNFCLKHQQIGFYNRSGVFTVRYGLSPYVTQIRFGLKKDKVQLQKGFKANEVCTSQYWIFFCTDLQNNPQDRMDTRLAALSASVTLQQSEYRQDVCTAANGAQIEIF